MPGSAAGTSRLQQQAFSPLAGSNVLASISASSSLTKLCIHTGPCFSTHKELWTLLTAKQLPITLPAVTNTENRLNNNKSVLIKGLLAQSGDNGTDQKTSSVATI
eukprot:GHRR01037672.1.p1 GENE.GHRR01037672.1~~GHRR01037672.1.p1  ORF type:complete len:105 (+),score=24.31 GHRR01037672.1:128-442(+)